MANLGGNHMNDNLLVTTDDVLRGIDMSGIVVLITGGTTGLGKESARALGAAGATVILTARSEEKGNTALAELKGLVPDGDFSFDVLELGSLESVRSFADRFLASHDRLDVLLANAGIMAVPYGTTDEGFELQFGTNHLGHFVLVNRLLPLLKASAPSRIVNLSSAGHFASGIIWDDPNFENREYSKMEAYGQSKTANILFTVELERRFGEAGVHAWAVHPGMVMTDLARSFTKDDFSDLASRAKKSGMAMPTLVNVDVGASTQVWACASAEPLDQPGSYLADRTFATPSDYASDPELAQRLWTLSEELVGESFSET
jgi:NAD(P)-dependent dehydrogenase (short-subunit alcohol dehydrogenase family)